MKNLAILCFALATLGVISSCKKLNPVTVTPTPTVDSLKVGLIAYYAFNGSVIDSSGRGNTGTPNNLTLTTDRNGKANSAYHFDGTTSCDSVKDNADLRLNNTNFTLSAWVYLDSYNSSGNNILTKHIVGNNNGWAWGIIATGVTFGPGGTSPTARGTKVVGLSQWHMVTVTYSVTTLKVSIYVDGVLDNVTSGIPSPPYTITAALYIGRDNPGVSANGYFVRGSLDEIRIYNRALSLNDIQKLYTYKY